MNPRVLIVTPTLGQSRYLEAAAASVASQPLDALHLLAAPADSLPRLAGRFPGCRVVPDGGKRGGIYGALNAALAAAEGEPWDWFTYINDDDLLLPGFGRMLRAHVERSDAEPVAYGDVELIDEGDRQIALITTESDPNRIPALLQGGISPVMQQGMAFSRDTVRRLGGFDTAYRLCADLDFWLRAYSWGARFRYHPKKVARFRIRHGQLSGNTFVTEREQAEIVARNLPVPVPRWRRRLAAWRYRVRNIPRYAARVRSRGFRTSYQLLREANRR